MFAVNPNVRWRWEGSDKILLNTMVGMNRTAGEVLELCRSHQTPEAVLTAMQERYPGVPPARLAGDVRALLDRFLRWHVLVPADHPDPASLMPPMTSRYLDHIASYFGNKLAAPVGVACELTLACDANCPHCSVMATKEMAPGELTTAEWKAFIDELATLGVFTLTFLGGEPLLRPDLEELIEYGSRRGLRAVVVTNGSALTAERIDSLARSGLREVQISLDGATAGTHDAFRGVPGLFDRLLGSIPALLARGIDVLVLTTIVRSNVTEIPGIIRLVDRLGVRRLDLMCVMAIGRAATHLQLRPERGEYLRLLSEVYAQDAALRTTFTLFPGLPAAYYAESIGLQAYQDLKRRGKIGRCLAGLTHCTVSPAGDIRPCGVSTGIAEGNIREKPLREIWSRSAVAATLRTVDKQDQVPCKSCRLRSICYAGCRALPAQIGPGGDPYQADPVCAACFASFPSWTTGCQPETQASEVVA